MIFNKFIYFFLLIFKDVIIENLLWFFFYGALISSVTSFINMFMCNIYVKTVFLEVP